MRLFLLIIAWMRALIATWKRPEQLSAEQRQRAVELVRKYVELDGLDTSVSDRCEFSSEIIEKASRKRGVYYIYEGDELKYIGASCVGIHWRLKAHYRDSCNWASGNIDKVSNKGLADLIASGRASVEWYACPFPGWIEENELLEYCEKHEGPPPLNSKCRSNLI